MACDLTSSGNYLIKWETFPPMTGTVKVYESSSPDSFNLAYPIVETSINRGFIDVIAIRSLNRSYFKLVFGEKYSVITSERAIQMNHIYNFRDLGGYYNKEGKQVRWGKIYRSSSLSPAPPTPPRTSMLTSPRAFLRNYMAQDMAYMTNLGIKSLISLRTESENFNFPSRFHVDNTFNLPLRGNRINVFVDKIFSGEMRRNDVIIHLQDVLSFLLENNSDYYERMFDVLLDESNYPLILYCSIGVDRSGIAAALILAALDIPTEEIINDFMLSNDHINYADLFLNPESFPDYVQETMMAIYSAHKETISYAFERITKEYGSMDNYFEKELNLTPSKREKLKKILLY